MKLLYSCYIAQGLGTQERARFICCLHTTLTVTKVTWWNFITCLIFDAMATENPFLMSWNTHMWFSDLVSFQANLWMYGIYQLVRWFLIRGRAWASMHNLLMFCHGTQIMDNSRICDCLLFHEHGKQNFVQPFRLSRKLLRYTHAWTKLHNEVMSWISGAVYMSVIMHGPYLKQTQLLCVIWRNHLWAACPCLSWFAVVLSSAWS